MDNFKDFFEEYDRLRFEYRSTEEFIAFLGVEKPHTLISRINLYRRNKKCLLLPSFSSLSWLWTRY